MAAGRRADDETPYQIASISKHLTAAVALLLVEDGTLALDDPVTRWLPTDEARWCAVTVHHLLTHTGGVGHWDHHPDLDLHERPSEPMVETLLRAGPSHPRGRFHYSSPGYVLLAAVVEQAANEAYAPLMERRLLAPAGMPRSFVGADVGDRAVALPHDGDERVRSFELDVVAKGAGDAWSTPDDLMRLDDAARDGRVLVPGAWDSVFRRHAEDPRTGHAYGYGWRLGELGGRVARYHGGDNGAYRNLHVWWPEADLRLVALTNSQRCTHEDLYTLADHVGRTC